jgi:DNA-binding IclR family transcriptional regulator
MNVGTMAPLVQTPRPVDLGAMIRAEYLEMPGLCLTLGQAARLWNVDTNQCREILETLTRTGFLYRSGDMYLKVGTGRIFV